MQSSTFFKLEATGMALNTSTMDLGFFSDSAASTPESQPPPPYSVTASPAHSFTESIDSAFHELDECFDGSFYNDSRASSPSQEKLKTDFRQQDNSVNSSRPTNLDLDWMSMPLIDFQMTEDQLSSSNTSQDFYRSNTASPVASSPEIDFHNLEIVLKEKAKEKMLAQQQMKCTQEEFKILQNIMLYKQQQQPPNVMFTEALNLPPQQTSINNPSSAVVIDDPLPDDFLASNCASLIDFINTGNRDAKFPDNLSLLSTPIPQYRPSFNFQPSKVEIQKQTPCQQQPPPQQRPTPKIIVKPKLSNSSVPKHTSKPRLFNFLVELLQNPDQFGNCIEWKDKEAGIFKFLDSAEVAKLWGHRKNKPNMKYENFARSLRTYIAKGILTKPRNKLVYQFVKTVI